MGRKQAGPSTARQYAHEAAIGVEALAADGASAFIGNRFAEPIGYANANAALFLAAAVRWGADFLGADVAMVSYPLPSSETEADWSQDSRTRSGHVPARRADRGHTVVASSSPLDVPRVTGSFRRLFAN